LPKDCATGPDWDALCRLHTRVVGGERNADLVAAFPFDDICVRAPWPWRGTAQRLYANLLGKIPKRSA
jgi:homoserine O-succinyltransferase